MYVRTKLIIIILIVFFGFGLVVAIDFYSDDRISALKLVQHQGLSALASISRLSSWSKELLIASKNTLDVIYERWKEVYIETQDNVNLFLQSKVLINLFSNTAKEDLYTLIKEQWNVATNKLNSMNDTLETYSNRQDLSKKGGLLLDIGNQNDSDVFDVYIDVVEGNNYLHEIFDIKYRELIRNLEVIVNSENKFIGLWSNITLAIIPVLIIIFYILFTRMIYSRLKKVEIGIKNVADGNFSSSMGIESNDEFGIVANNFDIFVKNIKFKLDSTLNYMRKVGSAMSDQLNIKEVTQLIVESAAENTQADGCILLLIDEENPENIVVEGFVGFYPPLWKISDSLKMHKIHHIISFFKNTPIKIGENIIGKAVADNAAVFIKNTESDERLEEDNLDKESVQYISSLIAVPLVISNRVIGAISVVKTEENAYFTDLDFNHMQSFADYATLTIGNLVKYIQLMERYQIEKEVGIAAQIQERLLPKNLPKLENSSIKAFSNPLKGVNGDYYDVITLDEDKVAIIMCDVAGKGVPAAIIMIMINTIIKLTSSPDRNASVMLNWLNKGLSGRVGEGNFATIGYVVFNQKTREILFANAAHIPIILYRESQKKYYFIDADGLPIGVDVNAKYQQKRLMLNKGDVIVMYTDGVSEAMNKEGNQYETDSIVKVLRKSVFLPADEILNKIKEDLAEFVKGAKQHDDQTLLVLKGN